MEIIIVAAIAKNGVIGGNNKLLWHLPNDLKHFKTLTEGQTVIMGRKTFESLKKPLPNRKNIVITSQLKYQAPEGVIIEPSIESALEKCAGKVFIIGGGEIYKQTIDKATGMELTHIDEDYQGDTYFPKIGKEWEIVYKTHHPKDEKHSHSFDFVGYKRVKDFNQ